METARICWRLLAAHRLPRTRSTCRLPSGSTQPGAALCRSTASRSLCNCATARISSRNAPSARLIRRSPWQSCGGATHLAAHNYHDAPRETCRLSRLPHDAATERRPSRACCGSIVVSFASETPSSASRRPFWDPLEDRRKGRIRRAPPRAARNSRGPADCAPRPTLTSHSPIAARRAR